VLSVCTDLLLIAIARAVVPSQDPLSYLGVHRRSPPPRPVPGHQPRPLCCPSPQDAGLVGTAGRTGLELYTASRTVSLSRIAPSARRHRTLNMRPILLYAVAQMTLYATSRTLLRLLFCARLYFGAHRPFSSVSDSHSQSCPAHVSALLENHTSSNLLLSFQR